MVLKKSNYSSLLYQTSSKGKLICNALKGYAVRKFSIPVKNTNHYDLYIGSNFCCVLLSVPLPVRAPSVFVLITLSLLTFEGQKLRLIEHRL
jgi:hypothetical protein